MKKDVFSTYEVSKYCQVEIQTVIDWIKQGILPAFRTPGGHRRILKKDLINFLKKYNMPIPSDLIENTKKKILIVDDDIFIVKLLTQLLKRIKHPIQIFTAKDGFEAGKLIVVEKPDLVILDILLPGLDGFEICRKIKSNKETKDMKIIAITGYDKPEYKKKILECGADAYFIKPLNIELLAEKILYLLALKQEKKLKVGV